MAIPSMKETRSGCPYGPALNEDRELGERELLIGEKERALALLEHDLEQRLDAARDRHRALLSRIEEFEEELDVEAREIMGRLPGLAPPLSARELRKAEKARRQAIAAREAALERRENMARAISRSLPALSSALEDAELEVRSLVDEAARRRAAQCRAARRRETEPVGRDMSTGGVRARREGFVQGQPQRLLPRARLDCEVDLGTDSNFYAGFAQNVSAGGLFVATFDLLPVGSEVDLCFSLPSERRISTRAVVKWIRDSNALTPDVWPGMGLQFQGLDPSASEAIESFVREREPLFFPDA
ncbi:MAG: TIGR02266 family protein [Myxococcota bacterium]